MLRNGSLLPKCRLQAYRKDSPNWRAELLVFDDDYYRLRSSGVGVEMEAQFPIAYEGEWSVEGVVVGGWEIVYGEGVVAVRFLLALVCSFTLMVTVI